MNFTLSNNWNADSVLNVAPSGDFCGTETTACKSGLKKSSIEIDRKILADLAVNQPDAFKALVDKAQSAR